MGLPSIPLHQQEPTPKGRGGIPFLASAAGRLYRPRTFGFAGNKSHQKNSSARTATVDNARGGCVPRGASQSQPPGKAFSLVAKKQLCKVLICQQCTMASRPLVKVASVNGLYIYFRLSSTSSVRLLGVR